MPFVAYAPKRSGGDGDSEAIREEKIRSAFNQLALFWGGSTHLFLSATVAVIPARQHERG
jgi:hypothetical protein